MDKPSIGLTEALARWVAEATYEALPREAVHAAKRALLDTLGVAIAGSTQPVGRIVIDYTRDAGGAPQAGVIGAGFKTNVANAAFANGVMAHATDYDDTWLPLGHPTCSVLPPVFALAEKLGSTGRDIILATVVGLEIHGKVGYGPKMPAFHTTGIYGALAAAAASAKMLGLDRWGSQMALAIVASHASGVGSQIGTMTKPSHAGNAAAVGVRAAMLAGAGFTGDQDALGAPRGYVEGFLGKDRFDTGRVIASLGNPYQVISPGIGVKKYPTCYLNHRALDAILPMVIDNDVRPEQVEEVVVTVPNEGWLNRMDIDFGLRGKFSIQYNMAEAILERRIVLESFADDHVHRPEAQAMMQRVRLKVDPTIPGDYEGAINPISIRLKDGRVFDGREDVPHGEWSDPLTDDELEAKYRDNALRVLAPSDCNRSVELLWGLDSLSDVRELAELYAGAAVMAAR